MFAFSMPSEVAGRHSGGWQHPCRHPLKAILRQKRIAQDSVHCIGGSVFND